MMSRSRIMLAVLVAMLLAVLLTAWLMRRPIAGNVIDDYLHDRQVQGSYELTRIDPQTQLLRHVVIGDPARPDLIAREIELDLGWSLTGVRIEAVRARGVRLRASLDRQGRLTLGALDRLMPAPSGEPFALPDYMVDIADSGMELVTPWGQMVAGLSGKGPIKGDFAGHFVVRSNGLNWNGCQLGRTNGALRLATRSGKIHVEGPVAAMTAACDKQRLTVAAPLLHPDIWLGHDLQSWQGKIEVKAASLQQGNNKLTSVSGSVGVDGNAKGNWRGPLILAAAHAEMPGYATIRRTLRFDGDYALSGKHRSATGKLKANGIAAAPALTSAARNMLAAVKGTPVEAIANGLDKAISRAGQSLDFTARVDYADQPGRHDVQFGALLLTSASGLRFRQEGSEPLRYGLANGQVMLGSGLSLSGGGFPETRLTMAPWSLGKAANGVLTIAPMRSDNERLAFSPVRFTGIGSPHGRVDTTLTLDGDFPGGRVDGFTMPIALRLGHQISLGNGGCEPIRFHRLAAAGAVFGRTELRACPLDGNALFRTGGRAGLRGGFFVAAPRLNGQMGDSPMTVAARRLTVPLVPLGFQLDDGAVDIGTGEDPHRFRFAQLAGKFDSTGVAGAFSALSTKLSAIPLLMDEGKGEWSLRQGVLDARGAVRVSDAAPVDQRFRPLTAPDFHLTLNNSVIRANGKLRHPASGSEVVDVAIEHDLSSANGHADLNVEGIYFRTDGLQPDMLTSTTLGVIANVRGDLKGRGRIDWTSQGVTSSGVFGTDNMDFAAAFGPVSGFSTELHFTDLLGLESAPGQVMTTQIVNPGMEVLDGTIRYHLLPGNRVEIEGGRWPFNGGFLLLDPTVLDLNASMERRMAFRVEGLDAAQFIQQLGYQNISATGIFDGVIPMIFDDRGGRIEGGGLTVREGGGTLAYVGELTRAQLGTYGKLAFDALRSIRYKSLTIGLEGALDGEIVTRVKFDGLAQEPIRPGAKVPFASTLKKLPFRFNISIRAPFRSLMNQAGMINDPRRMLRTYLPRPIEDIPGITP